MTWNSSRSRGPGYVVRFTSAVLACLCIVAAPCVSAQDEPRRPVPPREIVPEWGVVGQSGGLRTVFITADGLKDRLFVVQVLRRVVERVPSGQALEVLIFDERRYTPSGWPRKPQELEHLRARYVRDHGGKIERFVWVSAEDAYATPPKLKETEAPIGVRQPG